MFVDNKNTRLVSSPYETELMLWGRLGLRAVFGHQVRIGHQSTSRARRHTRYSPDDDDLAQSPLQRPFNRRASFWSIASNSFPRLKHVAEAPQVSNEIGVQPRQLLTITRAHPIVLLEDEAFWPGGVPGGRAR